MIEGVKNKMQQEEEIKAARPDTVRAVSAIKNEYHFPGGGIYFPTSVEAESAEVALELWKKKRKSVKPQEEKVEETKIEITE